LQLWDKRLGKQAEKFRFEKILSTLYSVIGFEDLSPEKMSVKTKQLLNTYQSEKARFDQIESWNNKD
jgi:hypothetical protein